MDKAKNGTNVYKAVCAVVFIFFSIVYLFYYQTDVLAAAQHIASGGKTHYDAVIGPVLLILGLKILQNGIQAIAKLKGIFYAITYFPSFLIMTLITDLPSGPDRQIDFGAWAWAFPLVIIVWAFLVYLAKQYQSIEVEARGGGLLSQVVGINLTLLLLMILMTCGIGNHNRLFHQRMNVEYLLSEKKYDKAIKAVDNLDSKDETLEILRAYALAKNRTIGNEFFKENVYIKSIIPSSKGVYTVIEPMNNIMELYKRSADWQLCEMLVKKDLRSFCDNLAFFYNLSLPATNTDSTSSNPVKAKAEIKQNEYADSILGVRLQKLPKHYQEALVLYNDRVAKLKQSYLNKQLSDAYQQFLRMSTSDRKKHFSGTYWLYYYSLE